MEINKIYCGDSLAVLKTLPDNSINCCVSSPPYWNLRDYGVAGQLGLESTPEEYVTNMVKVFREVRRVLRGDGTLWLNLGDCYCPSAPGTMGDNIHIEGTKEATKRARKIMRPQIPEGLKPKDLVGIPWRMAFALQADGWYLRSDIIWHKPNPMPESVRDRPTKAHEYLFLLSKSKRYYYNAEAIKEPTVYSGTNNGVGFGHGTDKALRDRKRVKVPSGWDTDKGSHGNFHREGRSSRDKVRGSRGVINNPPNSELRKSGNIERKFGTARGRPDSHLGASVPWEGTSRNKRTVWTISTKPFPEAHFATFPPKLIEPCILAGCSGGGYSFRPFYGIRNNRLGGS